MFDMLPIGLILVVVVGVLIILGLGHRVLDRMRLTDTQALVLLAVMLAGAFLPELRVARGITVDIGGALAPLGVAIYLIATAGTAMEKWRAISATALTAAVVYATDKLLPADPGRTGGPVTLDPVYLPALVGGLVAYLAGRSRRSAFIAGTAGVVTVDIINVIENFIRGVPGALAAIGGAGVFDATMVAGFLAVFLAEVIGETREFLQGGPRGDRPEGLLRGLRGRVLIGAEGGAADEGGGGAQGQAGAAREGGGAGETAGPLAGAGAAVDRGVAGERVSAVGTVASLALAAALVAGGAVFGPRVGGEGDEVRGALFTMRDESGRLLMVTGRRIHVGDEYIDERNEHYRVVRIQGLRATARLLGVDGPVAVTPAAPAPGRAGVTGAELFGGAAGGRTKRDIDIGIYHTHNDESYVTSQGTDSVDGRGGVHRVGDAFASALARKGFRVTHDQTIHLPHDRGAYRRSRRTAMRLIQSARADVLFDVHRDAGPWTMYAKKVDGQPVTQIRLVVGRENPQMGATLTMARELKSLADSMHPGLIKGIFMGQDTYNQDINPRSLLLEVGTEQNAMPSAQRGITMFADVVERWVTTKLAGGK